MSALPKTVPPQSPQPPPACPLVVAPARPTAPPRALKPRKARHAGECEQLEQLPNIGPSLAADLRLLGVERPQQLLGRDAFVLYRELCERRGRRQDPCVLDTFIAAVAFMGGAAPLPWWHYTAGRKALHGSV